MDDLLPDRFRVDEPIGRGAAADVYRAHDVVLDRPVAVKVFRPGHDRVALHRFAEEIRTLSALSHPGLIQVHSCGVHADRPYLAMRLVEGETLQSRLHGDPLSPARTTELGAVLADALAYVHQHGIVHRDVKPSNILLDANGAPFLTDFGIALTAEGTRVTRTNEIVGTPAYLAPEQVLGERFGQPVDIYALGLTLVECLTGVTEYWSGSDVATAVARLHRPPRVPKGLPPRLGALLRAMTERAPARRPTAAECARELRELATPGTNSLALPDPLWRSWIGRSVVGAAAVSALAAGLILTLGAASTQAPAPRAAGTAPPAASTTTHDPTPKSTSNSIVGPAAAAVQPPSPAAQPDSVVSTQSGQSHSDNGKSQSAKSSHGQGQNNNPGHGNH